jgi:DNA-binding NarL/FixJ family response regulator
VALPYADGEALSPEACQGIETLTDREREILKMISLGMPNKVIGAKLFITEKTVKTHANHVFRKLGVSSRLQATLVFQSYQRARRRRPPVGRGPAGKR